MPTLWPATVANEKVSNPQLRFLAHRCVTRMSQTLDCFTPASVPNLPLPLPARIGPLDCRWHPGSAADHSLDRPPATVDRTSPSVAWFDDVSEAPYIADSLGRGLALLKSDPNLAAIWLVSAQDPWSQLLFQHLPPAWAGLCLGPENPAVVLFRRSTEETSDRSLPPTRSAWGLAAHRIARKLPVAAACAATVAWDQLPADRLPPLTPARWPQSHAWRRDWLQTHLLPVARRETSDPCDQTALQAAVWQCQGELDLSHRQSQQHEGEGKHQMCDYWHAIMHRREPDYGNSKYWFRQLGRHPVFASLAARADTLLETAPPAEMAWRRRLLRSGTWDPFAMVDLTEAAAENVTLEPLARRLQALELITLWEHLLRQVQGTRVS